MAQLRVGTSGWAYRPWVGPFYPEGTKNDGMLAAYAARFPTVEAHHTYRRWPSAAVLAKWAEAVPDGFLFAPKLHMRVAARRDLDGLPGEVAEFVAALAPLGDRLGPVFVQLPSWMPCTLDRLDAFLAGIPDGVAAAFELPHASWADPAVDGRLAGRGAARVLVDRGEESAPPAGPLGGPFAYVRLRRDAYDDAHLDAWQAAAREAVAAGRDVYLYVKHDDAAVGPAYAARLAGA